MVRVTVAAETARSYTNACSFAQAAAIARTSLATAENSLRLVTAQERAGSVGRFEVEQAATAVANARAAVAPLDAQRSVALFELAGRKSVGAGKSVSVRVDRGGRRIVEQKDTKRKEKQQQEE